ncbi:MAG: BLUF domain-containing protein [Polyangiaceae bacterium]
MSEPLYELVYVSAARRPFSGSDLSDLLAKARARNLAHSVTGMLLHADGTFLQVLEGPEASVKQTFERIKIDMRHGTVLRLFEGEVLERTFAEWSMGFVDGRDSSASRVPGFNDFLQGGSLKGTFTNDTSRIMLLADQFRRGRWRQAMTEAAG